MSSATGLEEILDTILPPIYGLPNPPAGYTYGVTPSGDTVLVPKDNTGVVLGNNGGIRNLGNFILPRKKPILRTYPQGGQGGQLQQDNQAQQIISKANAGGDLVVSGDLVATGATGIFAQVMDWVKANPMLALGVAAGGYYFVKKKH